MPELPELETIRRDLASIVGKRVLAVRGTGARPLRRMCGLAIASLQRRGKYLIADLGQLELVIHLGMSGRLFLASTVPATPHLRLAIYLKGGSVLIFVDRRRFGRMTLTRPGSYTAHPTLATMGPEPLSKAFRLGDFECALARRRAPIKAVLLNQEMVAGIGNIYADEVLHRARIHPARRQMASSEVRRLFNAIRSTLAAAIRFRGTS